MAKATKRVRGPLSKQPGSTHEELIADLARQGITRAKIGGFDIDGVLRGKYVSLEKLKSALGKGFGFCDVVFGWDVSDVLYDNSKVTGWHSGYPDVHAVLDPSTLRLLPWEPGVVAMLADFRDESGAPHPACPRSILKRVIARGEREPGFSGNGAGKRLPEKIRTDDRSVQIHHQRHRSRRRRGQVANARLNHRNTTLSPLPMPFSLASSSPTGSKPSAAGSS